MIRLIDLEFPERPYLNMAFEEAIPLALGKGVVPETLRFWRNSRTIVIGRFQCPSLEVNFEKCLEHGVRVVRRFTGGGAVYHDLGNLNFALSLRRNSSLIGERLFRGFELAGMAVEIGLRELGLKEAVFKPVNKVFLRNRKISGMAGLITKDFIFVHGSILVSSNLGVLNLVLKVQNPKEKSKARGKFVLSERQKVITIKRALGKEIGLEEVKRAIKRGLEKALDTELLQGEISSYEERLAGRLYKEKYLKIDWSLGPCTTCPRRKMDEIMFRRLTFENIGG